MQVRSECSVGSTVKVVPWMERLYPKAKDKKGVVKHLQGSIAEVQFERTKATVAVEHLEKTV